MGIRQEVHAFEEKLSKEVKRDWISFLLLGLLLIATGIVAIIWPVTATLGVNIALAILIGIAGIAQVIHAFKVEGWKGSLLEVVIGLAKLAAAGFLFVNPIPGAIALTIIIAVLFIVSGFAKFVLGFTLRPRDGWGWSLFAGAVSLVAGVWIFLTLNPSFFVVPGIVVGVTFLMEGIASTMLGFEGRKAYKKMEEMGLTHHEDTAHPHGAAS
jgi:uncharacterized membrane protein HdeD (DUF308 family)